MGIEAREKIKAPNQESGMMLEIASALGRETEELGIDDVSKPSNWKKRLGTLMLAGTILAGVMAGDVKEAKAGGRNDTIMHDLLRTGMNYGGQGLSELIRGAQRAAEEKRRLQRDIIRQQVNQDQQLKKDAVKRGWQKQDKLDNTQIQLDASLIKQYRQELMDAKTPEKVKFVNDKYKSMIQLPRSSN